MSDLKIFPCQMSIFFWQIPSWYTYIAEAGMFQSQKAFPNTKIPNTAKQQQKKDAVF